VQGSFRKRDWKKKTNRTEISTANIVERNMNKQRKKDGNKEETKGLQMK
jgi:hypothetical protein